MTTVELKIKHETVQEMIADNDTLIITDPCYIIKDEHWQHYCNLEFCENPIGLDNYLRQYHNFGEVIAMETGCGDWTNEVVDVETNETLGIFSADAGMVICCTASDLANYGVDSNELLELGQKGCLTFIPSFSGHVVGEYQSLQTISDDNDICSASDRLAVIYGTSDNEQFGFTTLDKIFDL